MLTLPVELRALRPLMLRGRVIAAGESVRVAPLEAADALASGRVELANSRDRATVDAAVRDEIKRILRKLPKLAPAPPEAGPWLPLGQSSSRWPVMH